MIIVTDRPTSFDVEHTNGVTRVRGTLFAWTGTITVRGDDTKPEGFSYTTSGYGTCPSAAWLTAVAAWREANTMAVTS